MLGLRVGEQSWIGLRLTPVPGEPPRALPVLASVRAPADHGHQHRHCHPAHHHHYRHDPGIGMMVYGWQENGVT
eukprot:924733-Rhodomonas_salina.1